MTPDPITLVERLKLSRNIAEQHDTAWYDPSFFPDAEKAAERIRYAIKNGETIGLFGDYDCDGVTSAAQMIRALRRAGTEPIVRLPHRVHDGYGLKPQHADEFHAAGVKLLITVDTGVSAHDAVERANALGIDTIILDHHHVTSVPPAYAIVHPSLAPTFPGPHPSAAGVVFMFLHALEKNHWPDRDSDVVLATMGTIADLVMLRGINRTLVQAGLAAIPRLPEGPLRTLMDSVSSGKTITSTDIGFRVAPRINAAGRLADPMLALGALLEGGKLLNDLATLNALRQDETTRAFDHALRELSLEDGKNLPSFLSVASAAYPHGIVGLLAGKLTERFSRPSMAVHISGELCTASMRSPACYNIVEALGRNKELLLSYGGHAQAAGATFALEHYLTLCEQLEADAKMHIEEAWLIPTMTADAALAPRLITNDFCMHLSALEPYGQGNAEPLFLMENVTIQNTRRVGTDGRHLQGYVEHCKIIGFGLGTMDAHTHEPVDILCRVGMDTWNGKITPQLFVQDVRKAEGSRSKKQEKTELRATSY